MNRLSIIFLSALSLFGATSYLHANAFDDATQTATEQIQEVLLRQNGNVLDVESADVYISLGRLQGVTQGEIVEITSLSGNVIRDPDTGEILGGAEQALLSATVQEVFPQYSVVRVQGGSPKAGDVVRRTLRQRSLIVLNPIPLNFPLGEDRKSQIANGVVVGLSNSNQLRIVERNALRPILTELQLQQSGLADAQSSLTKVGKLAGVELVVELKLALFPYEFTLWTEITALETGELLASYSDTRSLDAETRQLLQMREPQVQPPNVNFNLQRGN